MIVGTLYTLAMTFFFIRKGCKKIRYYDEVNSIRYRPLYDRIPGALVPFNKLYSLIFMMGKLMIIIALVTENAIASQVFIIILPVSYLIHEIV